MKILDRLPIPAADAIALVGPDTVRFKKHQIIVWVSLTDAAATQLHPLAHRFPAILDTGHTHDFAIQNRHLARWAGVPAETLRALGHIRHARQRIPLRAAKLWLHRNRPSTMVLTAAQPQPLSLLDGIAVFPDGDDYPRLPLVGLRALLSNRLHVAIDGHRASVTMRTPDWRTRLLSWLT